MKHKCIEAIERFSMLSRGDTVVVAVSGGADSMALLSFMHKNADVFGVNVIAAHFHHGIRGVQADGDMAFVEEYCQYNKIPFFAEKADVPMLAEQMRMGLEECGRTLRYRFLQSVAGSGKIATAHTNSDSCESFLLNFARGTGLNGLGGIPPVRDNIIRPLILCSAQDTRDYCIENGIAWREDDTNDDARYSRNNLRKNAVPVLKEINAAFEENALRCMLILRDENRFLSQMAAQTLAHCECDNGALDLRKLSEYDDVLVNRVLYLFAEKNGCRDLSLRHVQYLKELSGSQSVTLTNRVVFDRTGDLLTVRKNVPEYSEFSVDLQPCDAAYPFECGTVVVRYATKQNVMIDKYICAIDIDKINHPVFRSRKDGDSLRPKGRNCKKTFKQLCAEKKIAVNIRSGLPVLADENGVIWIAGLGVDERRIADENTENFLILEWRANNVI